MIKQRLFDHKQKVVETKIAPAGAIFVLDIALSRYAITE